MDSRSRIAFILATLILANELAPVVGFCCLGGDGRGCCCCCCLSFITTAASTVTAVYRVLRVLHWAWEFGEFLKDKDFNNPKDLQELSIWILNNPPPIEMKYKIVLFILRYVLDTETQNTYHDHVLLKHMSCENNTYCETGRDILLYFS